MVLLRAQVRKENDATDERFRDHLRGRVRAGTLTVADLLVASKCSYDIAASPTALARGEIAAIRSASRAKKLGFQYMLLDKFEHGNWTGQVLGGCGAHKRVFATVAESRLTPFRPRTKEGGEGAPVTDSNAADFDAEVPDFGNRGACSSVAATIAVSPPVSSEFLTTPTSDAPSPVPHISMSSANGPFVPAQLHGLAAVGDAAKLTPLEGLNLRIGNIADTGSGTIVMGLDAFKKLVTADPTCVRQVPPRPTSIGRINGVGAGHSNTLFHVRLTLEMGGARFTHEDVPVNEGLTGIILGNDFNTAVRANYDYTPFTVGGRRFDGALTLRGADGKRLSRPIPLTCSPHADTVPAFVSAVDAEADCAKLAPSDNLGASSGPDVDAETLIKSMSPIAYTPQRVVVPAWSEKILSVRAPAALLEGFDVAILPLEDERRNDVGVAVSPGLYRPDENGLIHTRVVNASTRPVAIPMLTPLARFIIDPKSDDSDIQFTTEEVLEKINIEENCTAEDRAKIAKMLDSRRRLFATKLGWAHAMQMSIETPGHDDGSIPIPARPDSHRRSREEEAALKKFLDKQLAERLIEPCRSPYSAVPMLVRKADWTPENPTYRCVLDYRALNLATVKDTYPLPNVDRNLVALGKANLFTTCDLLQGFHQVELTDTAKIKTAFITPWGQFAYTRMPMGLTSSPGTFMRLVDATLRGLPPSTALAFVDDIIIPTQGSIDDHLDQVGKVFDRLIEGGFTVRCDKVYIAMREVKYLGFLVGAYGTRPDPKKTQALLDITVEQMKYDPAAAGRFAGMMGYYHKFIPHLHTLLAPFHELKQKGADAVKIMSSLAFKASFHELKRRLIAVTQLKRPDFSKPFYVDVDSATSGGVGAALSQREDAERQRRGRRQTPRWVLQTGVHSHCR